MATESILLPTGVTVEYELVGPSGAPVVCFVHGLGAAMEQFQPQVDHFSGRYRVLRLSHRGHGRSGEPPIPEPKAYTPRALAEDLHALVEQLGIEELHFVGNSLGGLVGYELLKMRQPRLRSFTTFGTTAELRSSKMKYWMVVGSIRLFGMLFGNSAMASLLEKSGSKDREVGKILKRMFLCARQDALTMITRNIANYDYTPVLSASDVPVLLIRGELDKEINATLSSTLAAIDRIPNGRVVSLADAGHFANMEQPEEFNRVLGAFLEEVQQC